ncbi:MAG: sulfatase-like hydrolase/transferase [Planctomycetales bacterium]|nr:sulfatase-like hydrolase/transferase [Planctomycetales bacterium]
MRSNWTMICLALLAAGWAGTAAGAKPNILLIMADDVGTDAVGCYGGQSYPTPHIDALARGGMQFSHGYAMPVCHPSRVCLTTGRYPFRFGPAGSKWGDFPRDGESLTIAHRLKQAGYATAVAGKWQLCMMRDDLEHPRRLGFDQWCLFGWHEGGRYHDPLIYQNGAPRDDTAGKYGPDLYVDFLLEFMKRSQAGGQPFFAYYPMALCHDVTDDLKGQHVPFYQHGRWMTYGEMIASMDDMVGRLIAGLEQLGLRESTLVLFTTDNGTAAASYLSVDANGKMTRPPVFNIRDGRVVRGGKGKFDDTGTRVPVIANWPGRIQPGSKTDTMVDLTDYLPTMADVAGLAAEATPRDGISFAPVLFGEPRKRDRPWIYIDLRGSRCVRSPHWKLYDDGRFYDLQADPDEQTPLEPNSLPPSARAERQRLREALDGLRGPLAVRE